MIFVFNCAILITEGRMENLKIKEIEPDFYAQVCPNCNGRSTVGYDKHPCPTCGHTDHPGIVYVPIKSISGGKNEKWLDKNSL